MKKLKYLLISFLFFYNYSFGQTTITLQPGPTDGNDAFVWDYNPNTNFGTNEGLDVTGWTATGTPYISRGLLQFDLSSIPAGAVIINAQLSLYHNNTITSYGGVHSGANASYLQRATSNWQGNSVTWNNQPSTTTINQIVLPQTISGTQNFTNVDVTNLVSDMINNPATSFGFMLRLQNESPFSDLVFASSNHTNPSLHPKLEITYDTAVTCMTLQPGISDGKDAFVWDYQPNSNFGNAEGLDVTAWTAGATPYISRAFFQFDFTSIPANAQITSADLSLFHNNTMTSYNGIHNGANESFIQRVTGNWQENTINWSNQPATSNINQLSLPATVSGTQDFLNLDVKNLVVDMMNNPATSFGFMLRLQNEVYYSDLVFASSDHPNATLHPKLEVCYTVPTSVQQFDNSDKLSLYPNPVINTSNLVIDSKPNITNHIMIYDETGRKVFERKDFDGREIAIRKADFSKGIYLIKVVSSNGKSTSLKFVVE
ncbi:MAG: DNRLRE domain-containing protein [Bacteroidia bacterium]